MNKAVFAGLVLLTAAGCVTPTGGNSGPAEEKEYVTGSNLPRKDRSGVKTLDPAELERMRSSLPNAGRSGN